MVVSSLQVGVGRFIFETGGKAVNVTTHVSEQAGPLALDPGPFVHVRTDCRLLGQLLVHVRCSFKMSRDTADRTATDDVSDYRLTVFVVTDRTASVPVDARNRLAQHVPAKSSSQTSTL